MTLDPLALNRRTGDVFTKYRNNDKVRFNAKDGTVRNGVVLGNLGGHLTIVPEGESHGIHVGYKNAVLVEANPRIPLEARQ